MSVTITNRTYSNPFRAETTDWLLANVGTWQKLAIEFSVTVEKQFSLSNLLQYERPNKFTLSDGSKWSDIGLVVGDSISLEITDTDYSGAPVDTTTTYNMIVTALNNGVMLTDAILGDIDIELAFIPGRIDDIEYSNIVIYANKQPQEIDFFYNQLSNDDRQSNSLNSFIDGTKTGFSAIDVDTMVALDTQLMTKKATQSGMSVEPPTLTYDGNSGRYYNYTIEFVYMLSSFFEDITNFEDNIAPSQVFSANSLTDNFKILAYPVANNPNIVIENDMSITQQLGNTGWFNENFNGKPNVLVLDSITYEKTTGETVSQLDYANEIKVTARISGVANLSTLTSCAFGFMWIPLDEEDYKNLDTPFHENAKISSGGSYFSDVFNVSAIFDATTRQGYSIDGSRMDVKDIRFSEDTGILVFEATFVPSADFTEQFKEKISDRNYILWISAADRTLDTNHSDRVSLLIDYRSLESEIEPVGEFSPMTISFLDHAVLDYAELENPCGVDIKIEDDLLAKVEFSLDSTVDFTPKGITFAIVAERTADGEQYELERYPIDLSQYPSVGGVYQFNFSEIRGFQLPIDNNKNDVKVIRDATNDSGTLSAYLGLYGFKVRWEDWIQRTNVPADFYNTLELNNGSNNDWYQYLDTVGWNIYFVVWLDGETTANNLPLDIRYENKKELVFADYDSNADITTTINYFRQSTGSALSGGTDPISGLPLGVILEGELVRVEIEYERSTGTWAGVANSYGVTTIEVDQGAGFKALRQISTEYEPRQDNPLQPLDTETKLKIELVSSTIIKTTCLIDSDLLTEALRYKITGRLGCK